MKVISVLSQDPYLFETIKKLLGDLPLKVLPCFSQMKPMLESFRSTPSDILFVDSFQAGSNGIDVVKSLRKSNDSLVVILVNRMSSRLALEQAFRVGTNDVIQYPFQGHLVKQVVLHRLENLQDDGMVYFE